MGREIEIMREAGITGSIMMLNPNGIYLEGKYKGTLYSRDFSRQAFTGDSAAEHFVKLVKETYKNGLPKIITTKTGQRKMKLASSDVKLLDKITGGKMSELMHREYLDAMKSSTSLEDEIEYWKSVYLQDGSSIGDNDNE